MSRPSKMMEVGSEEGESKKQAAVPHLILQAHRFQRPFLWLKGVLRMMP